MNEDSSRKSSRRSCKSNSEEVNAANVSQNQWPKRKFTCSWNMTCKALFLGLMLMFLGGSMATIGYFVDHIYMPKDTAINDTVVAREKSKLNVNSISTYVGPMIMGVGGFIVVAACVMTFEQRDNAVKVIPTRLHLNSAHGHSINRHNKSSPSLRLPAREGSGRRHNPAAGYLIDVLEDFTRRDLTADFIQFSRNLQQANIQKSLSQQVLGRSPSAPNLANPPDLLPTSKATSPRHTKHSCNSLHPLIGQPFLSPHTLHRQALSVDNPEYTPHHMISPPRSKRTSRQGSTGTARGSAESLMAELSRRSHSSQASMMLDLHMPNDWPVSMRIRDRNRRSDTARRHCLVRQAQIEGEEDSAERDSRCSSPQFGGKGMSSSTPHSRRESYSPRMASIDDPVSASASAAAYQYKYRPNETLSRGSSPSLPLKRASYLRSNTISHETTSRRGSHASEAGSYRKGSADYNYRNRRKSSNTSDSSSRYCPKSNVDEMKSRRSPTASLKSFQELRYISQKLCEQEAKGGDRLRQASRKNRSSTGRVVSSSRTNTQSLSPDRISVSSSTTDGHSKSDFTSIEVEPNEEEFVRKT